ncbi:MAG: glycosyltransferase [Candidatus Dormibacteria bacterium]
MSDTTRGRFLISTWDGGGNVPPAMALGARLRRRGHEVRVISSRSLAGVAAGAGLDFTPLRRVPEWPDGLPLDDDWPRLNRLLFGRDAALDIADELRAHPVDVLVADCMSGATMAAGAATGTPMAILVHMLYTPFAFDWGAGMMDFDTSRRALGLDALPPAPLGDQLAALGRVLCATPPGLDASRGELPQDTFYVGPVLPPEPPGTPWSPRTDAPLVLVSFSTTLMHQRESLQPILDALAALPIEGVLTLGGALPVDEITAPPNFTVREYVPHAAILPHASVVVSHAGLTSITAALAHGVPLVCIPQGREQPLNAERLAAAGAGIHVPGDAPATAVAETLTVVLEDPRYRTAAGEMAARSRELGLGEEAARLTEELLSRVSPTESAQRQVQSV